MQTLETLLQYQRRPLIILLDSVAVSIQLIAKSNRKRPSPSAGPSFSTETRSLSIQNARPCRPTFFRAAAFRHRLPPSIAADQTQTRRLCVGEGRLHLEQRSKKGKGASQSTQGARGKSKDILGLCMHANTHRRLANAQRWKRWHPSVQHSGPLESSPLAARKPIADLQDALGDAASAAQAIHSVRLVRKKAAGRKKWCGCRTVVVLKPYCMCVACLQEKQTKKRRACH